MSESARRARELVAPALDALQHLQDPPEYATRALEHAAAAMGALYGAWAESESDTETAASIRSAHADLSLAFTALEHAPAGVPEYPEIRSGIAHALALLYPVLGGRRASDPPAAKPLPPAATSGAHDAPKTDASPTFDGVDHRAGGERVPIEVDVGLLSDSNFYTGLSQDISQGGVFVASGAPLESGRLVTLYFTLDGGRIVRADGAVRWSRGAESGLAPGMGVGFEALAEDDRRAIAEYCANRPPLFHEE